MKTVPSVMLTLLMLSSAALAQTALKKPADTLTVPSPVVCHKYGLCAPLRTPLPFRTSPPIVCRPPAMCLPMPGRP